MAAGGSEYVLKSMAGHQLIGAIMTALRGGAGTA